MYATDQKLFIIIQSKHLEENKTFENILFFLLVILTLETRQRRKKVNILSLFS